ncbi:hypothetical protein ACSSS7_008055 [Eimeria intestinalis]
MSKLARFKEQIRAKKLLKQQLRAQQHQQLQQQEGEAEGEKTEAQTRPSNSALTTTAIANTSTSNSSSRSAGQEEADEEIDEGGEFLELKRADVEPPEESSKLKNQRLQEILMRKPGTHCNNYISFFLRAKSYYSSCLRILSVLEILPVRFVGWDPFQRERLQFRADGTAKVKGLAAASVNTHVLFDDDEDSEDKEIYRSKTHASSSSSSSSGGSGKMVSELRAAFLQQMRRKVESVQQDDKGRGLGLQEFRYLASASPTQGDFRSSGASATLLSGEESDNSAEESGAGSIGEIEAVSVPSRTETRGPHSLKRKRKEGVSVEALEQLALQAAAAS